MKLLDVCLNLVPCSCSIGIGLPVYSTFKAIENRDQSAQRKWLIYWAGWDCNYSHLSNHIPSSSVHMAFDFYPLSLQLMVLSALLKCSRTSSFLGTIGHLKTTSQAMELHHHQADDKKKHQTLALNQNHQQQQYETWKNLNPITKTNKTNKCSIKYGNHYYTKRQMVVWSSWSRKSQITSDWFTNNYFL